MQQQGIEYFLKYSPVSLLSTLVALLSLAVKLKLTINQMDVITTLLSVVLDETLYLRSPTGFSHLIPHRTPQGKLLRFLKAIYCLKQTSMEWNKRLNGFLKKQARKEYGEVDR